MTNYNLTYAEKAMILNMLEDRKEDNIIIDKSKKHYVRIYRIPDRKEI